MQWQLCDRFESASLNRAFKRCDPTTWTLHIEHNVWCLFHKSFTSNKEARWVANLSKTLQWNEFQVCWLKYAMENCSLPFTVQWTVFTVFTHHFKNEHGKLHNKLLLKFQFICEEFSRSGRRSNANVPSLRLMNDNTFQYHAFCHTDAMIHSCKMNTEHILNRQVQLVLMHFPGIHRQKKNYYCFVCEFCVHCARMFI